MRTVPPAVNLKVRFEQDSLPEAGFDLTAAVDVTFVLHGERQVSQVVQTDA